MHVPFIFSKARVAETTPATPVTTPLLTKCIAILYTKLVEIEDSRGFPIRDVNWGKTGINPQKSPKFGDRDKGTPFKNIWDTPGTGIVHKTGN